MSKSNQREIFYTPILLSTRLSKRLITLASNPVADIQDILPNGTTYSNPDNPMDTNLYKELLDGIPKHLEFKPRVFILAKYDNDNLIYSYANIDSTEDKYTIITPVLVSTFTDVYTFDIKGLANTLDNFYSNNQVINHGLPSLTFRDIS